MKKTIILIACIISLQFLHSQTYNSEKFGLKKLTLKDSNLGIINYYVTLNTITKEKPLLVYVDGSSALPLYCIIKKSDGSKNLRTGIALDLEKLSNKFHIVIISKPGIPFADSLEVESIKEFKKNYYPPETYKKMLSHDWRVNSASLVIDTLAKTLPIKNNEVIALGYSEGGQVVPKLALINTKITKLINVVGGGLNQFYDLILEERINAQSGRITSEKAQKNIDSLYKEFEAIYSNPKAIDKEFWGDTYLRWSSFCKNIPIEDMTKLDIPILMISAGKDQNAPILSLDYAKLEFMRLRKTNLTYKVYPNCDHYFYDLAKNEDRLDEVIDMIVDWVDDN